MIILYKKNMILVALMVIELITDLIAVIFLGRDGKSRTGLFDPAPNLTTTVVERG